MFIIILMIGILVYSLYKIKKIQGQPKRLQNEDKKEFDNDNNIDQLFADWNLFYNNNHAPNSNEYYYYCSDVQNHKSIHIIFPKPDTKTLKVDQWSKKIKADRIAILIKDPDFLSNDSKDQNQQMFDEIFNNYVLAYVQSFTNYRDYEINIDIQKAHNRNKYLGVADQMAIINFTTLSKGDLQNANQL